MNQPGDDANAVEVRGLSVVRGGATILRDISLSVPRGVIYGLVGPSGSGKTTLIRAIVGRQRITAGMVRAAGVEVGSAELRERIGYMPQEAGVYDDLSARATLAFFAAIYRVPPGRVDEVLRLVDLEDVAGRPAFTYSGGQRRRVSLAVALLPQPPLLLLDEPTVGMDPRLRVRLWSQFAEWASGGTTLVVSTHVMDEAARVDRLAFLSEGAIVAEGTPVELLDRAGATDLEGAFLRLTAPLGAADAR